MADFQSLPLRVKTAAYLGGAVVVLFILAAIYEPSKFLLVLAATAAVAISVIEYVELSSGKGILSPDKIKRFVPLLLPIVAVLICRGDYLIAMTASLLVGISLRVAVTFLSRINTREMMVKSLNEDLLAFVLIGAGGSGLISLLSVANGEWAVLWLMLVIIANDVAAYFGGTKLQGPKLAPEVSPNKTVSGSLCGIAAGILTGWIAAGFLPGKGFFHFSLCFLLITALLVISAQLGDLIKSFIKRLHGVKDTGNILPGHGGMLDRIDGILGAAPLMFLWIRVALH